MTEETEAGVVDPVAVDQEEEQPQEEQQSDKEHNFAAMRETLAAQKRELDELRQQNRLVTDQVHLYQENLQQHKQQAAEPKRDPDDLMTFAETQKMLQEQQAQFQSVLAETQMRARYKDFDEVVNKENLEPIIQEFPELRDVVMSSKDPNLLAYVIGSGRSKGQSKADHKDEQAERAKKVIENAQKPGVASNAVGGSGSLGKADRFANMTRQEFNAYVEGIKRKQVF